MTGNSYSVFNAMVDIVASPGKALDEIKLHTSWLWWPLLITMILASSMMAYYYSWVDFPWLVEETIRQVPAENRAESADAIRQFMQPGRSMWTTVIAIVLMSFIIYAIQASYLHLANKLITGADIGYGQWFSFSVGRLLWVYSVPWQVLSQYLWQILTSWQRKACRYCR